MAFVHPIKPPNFHRTSFSNSHCKHYSHNEFLPSKVLTTGTKTWGTVKSHQSHSTIGNNLPVMFIPWIYSVFKGANKLNFKNLTENDLGEKFQIIPNVANSKLILSQQSVMGTGVLSCADGPSLCPLLCDILSMVSIDKSWKKPKDREWNTDFKV